MQRIADIISEDENSLGFSKPVKAKAKINDQNDQGICLFIIGIVEDQKLPTPEKEEQEENPETKTKNTKGIKMKEILIRL